MAFYEELHLRLLPLHSPLGFAYLSLNGGHKPFEIVLHYVVTGTSFHRRHRSIFVNGSGHDDEGQVKTTLMKQLRGSRSTETGQRMVGNNNIPYPLFKCRVRSFKCLHSFGCRVVATMLQFTQY